jgi:hypothetical protein
MGRERAAPQGTVFVEELERGLIHQRMRGQYGGGVVRGEGGELAGGVGPERIGSNRMKGPRAVPGSCRHCTCPGRTHSHWPGATVRVT